MKIKAVRNLRRLSQALFLILFLFLLLKTEYRGSFENVEEEIRLTYPVRVFLDIYPLAVVATGIISLAL